jgi:hypothetical protein
MPEDAVVVVVAATVVVVVAAAVVVVLVLVLLLELELELVVVDVLQPKRMCASRTGVAAESTAAEFAATVLAVLSAFEGEPPQAVRMKVADTQPSMLVDRESLVVVGTLASFKKSRTGTNESIGCFDDSISSYPHRFFEDASCRYRAQNDRRGTMANCGPTV